MFTLLFMKIYEQFDRRMEGGVFCRVRFYRFRSKVPCLSTNSYIVLVPLRRHLLLFESLSIEEVGF